MPDVRLREPVLMGVLAALAVGLLSGDFGTLADVISVGVIVAAKVYLLLTAVLFLLERGKHGG